MDIKIILTADCYRLVGYPSNFKSKRKPLPIGNSYEAGQYQNGLNNSRSGTSNHVETSNFRAHANNVAYNNMLPDK